MKIVIVLDVPIEKVEGIENDYRDRDSLFLDNFKVFLRSLLYSSLFPEGSKVDSVIMGVKQ